MAAQHILYGISIGLFVCAAAISIGVITATVAPQWRRIAELLSGQAEPLPHAASIPVRAAVLSRRSLQGCALAARRRRPAPMEAS
ncbi:hypothetical protein [Sphingomonas hylomeconis]|uniref:Uncharacterized protein n=1 Tax=Sphingomonas hylomeconis TaxID=1395958 RepID=A0ABV7SS42_9SPHN|nr:hypothetical protein [Sphingomonas hylomeconis]